MKNVFLLGAGASKAYNLSPTGQFMPVANDFFSTYSKLPINFDPWALKDKLLCYLYLRDGVDHLDLFDFNEDIEDLHSEIQIQAYDIIKNNRKDKSVVEQVILGAYYELIFLFIAGINQIQSGPISQTHLDLAKLVTNDDTIITFNWDTLMDRALMEITGWNCDTGYYVKPLGVYRDKWMNVNIENVPMPKLLKLHGSSNWLTSYVIFENGKQIPMQVLSADNFFVYESTQSPYSTYEGRYMDGYQPFSYGYYPPNLQTEGRAAPDGFLITRIRPKNPLMREGTSDKSGIISMPLIIPPVRDKKYDFYGNLFVNLWAEAEKQLIEADKIFVIGYSFPKTDLRSSELFKKAFSSRTTIPEVIIINPVPEAIEERFIYDLGLTADKLITIKDYFSSEVVKNVIVGRVK